MMTPNEIEALETLLQVANSNTGQARHCADFLLAWWNAEACGGFDLAALWSVDRALTEAMLVVCGAIARLHSYPDTLGYSEKFAALVSRWRPES